jgi:hypothetical protein
MGVFERHGEETGHSASTEKQEWLFSSFDVDRSWKEWQPVGMPRRLSFASSAKEVRAAATACDTPPEERGPAFDCESRDSSAAAKRFFRS